MAIATRQDLLFALRGLRRQSAYAAGAILTLALGIGASTAIFSVVYGVLLKPLPFADAGQLVSLLHRSDAAGNVARNHGPATYFTYRDNQRAFESIGAWETNEVSITGLGEPERIEALAVSAEVLPLLRVQPLRGRGFNEEDDTPGQPQRAILTYGYWQRRFGGAQDAIGQRVDIDGNPVEIIGVLPASFRFLGEHPSLLLPMQLDRADADHIEFDFQALARLKPGVTLEQANADIARMIPLLPRPFGLLKLRPFVNELRDYLTYDIRGVLWILFGVVGVVLLLSCVNVANLFLIRAEGRQQELATRAALGASATDIARALLTESVLLALGGGVLGTGLAQGAIGVLRRIAPAQLPRVEDITINSRVLFFAFAISVFSGFMFGLFAVLRFGRPRVSLLKESGRSGGAGRERQRTRNVLVVAQVAMALMLLTVAGLMIRTFVAMRAVEPGFARPEQVQTFVIAIPETLLPDENAAVRTHEAIADRLKKIPGVSFVGLSSSITMDGEDNGNVIAVEEFPVPAGTLPPLYRFKSIGPGYFEAMGNRVVAGRSITWQDIYQRKPVIVLSETLARRYWREPLLALGKRVRGSDGWREIVGVSGAEHDDGLNRPPTPIVYWPMLNESYRWRTMAYAVRSGRTGTASFRKDLEHAVWSVNPGLPLAAVQTLARIERRSMAETSFATTLLAIAAGVALLLGVVGIYGVIAYVAALQTRSIGIRIALGASATSVRILFVRRGLVLTAAGIAIGLGLALVFTRGLSARLFGVAAFDPLTYAAGAALIALAALVATYVPARRASRIDPLIAMRH